MDEEEELSQAIRSCILCGNGISKRSLNLLSSTIRSYAEEQPHFLIKTISDLLCVFDSPIVPTRILSSMSQDLNDIPSTYFSPIIHLSINMISAAQPSSIVCPLHNIVFLLPEKALESSKATIIANNIVALLSQYIHQTDTFQILATALSQFMKKWAPLVTQPEIPISSLFTLLTSTSHSFSTLSLLCQSSIYLILAMIGDSYSLKELLEDLYNQKDTILDKCTSVANINFLDFALQTLSPAAQYQLIASFLFSLPPEKYIDIANKFQLLKQCIMNPPSDELSQACFYTMLSAILKVTAKQMTPHALDMCCRALLSCPDSQDVNNRRAMRYCFSSLLQCANHTQSPQKFIEMLWDRIMNLPPRFCLRQDAIPLLIPVISFSFITKDFFDDIICLYDTYQGMSLRCICEIYKKFDVPLEYSTILFRKLEGFNPSVRTAIFTTLLKSSIKSLKLLKKHTTQCQELDENRRVTMLLSIASVETTMTHRSTVSLPLLRDAIHSWDFEVRLAALRLLCGQGSFTGEAMKLLYDSITRIFVYCDVKHEKALENCLESIIPQLINSKEEDLNKFTSALFKHMMPLLQPHQSGVKKSYIINSLKIVWRYRPLFLLSENLIQQLIHSLFESSYSLRDLVFRTLLLIVKKSSSRNESKVVKEVLAADSEFITKLIESNKDSPRFREADGAARLIALLHVSSGQPIDETFVQMWKEYTNQTDPIPSHFPLSVILHFMQSSSSLPLNVQFINQKLLPNICQLITNSLDYMGAISRQGIENLPILNIRNEIQPESQLHMAVNKSWLAVRQSLNIISCIINRYFDDIPSNLLHTIGDSIFRFLMDSRHFSTVYHAHLTFQTLCARCFMRDDCTEFPIQWCLSLLDTAETFSGADHRSSNGFVQTALALIHSEPVHLFGSQRSMYHTMISRCFNLLENPCNNNELISALMLSEAIATDSPTQSNLEPYLPQLLLTVFSVNCQPLNYELKNTANHCLTSLLLKHWRKKSDDPREPDRISQSNLFNSVNGIFDFFIEHLDLEQSDMTFVIFQVIQMMQPFQNDTLQVKISENRVSPYARVRRAAARSLLIVLPPNNAEQFVRQCLKDLKASNNSNELDGILMQIQQIVGKYQHLHSSLLDDIKKMCQEVIDNNETRFMHLYCMISLANEFGVIDMLKPVLMKFFSVRKSLVNLPLGHKILRYAFNVLKESEMIDVLRSNNLTIIIHLLLHIGSKPIYSREISNVIIDLFLNNPPIALFDITFKLMMKKQNDFKPNEEQRKKFVKLLGADNDDEKLISLVYLIPLFVDDVRPLLGHFNEYTTFVDRSDSNILDALSKLTLEFHDQLFSEFDEKSYLQWKLALRLISDECPAIRFSCCKALSIHFNQRANCIELCEFDLIKRIYNMMRNHTSILKALLTDLLEKREDEGESHFKKEPTPFIHPPSFHIQCIQHELSQSKS